MIAIGFALGWVGYSLSFWGYSLVRGYNLSFTDIFSPSKFYSGTWPPTIAPNTTIFPNGSSAPSSSAGLSGAASALSSANTALTNRNQGKSGKQIAIGK